jgi:hypothetical protein
MSFERRGLLRSGFGRRNSFVIHFYFALPVAFRAVTGITRRLATILAFISRGLSNQNVDQRGMDRILTFFRSATFRTYERRHMNSSFFIPAWSRPSEYYRKMVGREDRASDQIVRAWQENPVSGRFQFGKRYMVLAKLPRK